MEPANHLRSIGYPQERLHTGLIKFLAELHTHGKREPIQEFLSRLTGAPVARYDTVTPRFEWKKADLVLEVSMNGHRQLVVIEMKVDSIEGGFFHEVKQTDRMFSAFDAEGADALTFLYITLGDAEYAGPPANENFRWIGLDAFREAVRATDFPSPAIAEWDCILREEQDRRQTAPTLASAGHLWPGDPDVGAAGYRARGVHMSVYGVLMADWSRGGWCQQFGTPKAYVLGRGPDAILNFWELSHSKGWHYYFEVNQRGRLSLKVDTWWLDHVSWSGTVDAVQSADWGDQAPRCVREPRTPRGSNTICSWDVGLWSQADDLALVARRIAHVIESCVPKFDALLTE